MHACMHAYIIYFGLIKLQKLQIIFTEYATDWFSVELVNNEKVTVNYKCYSEYQSAWQYFDVYISDNVETASFIPWSGNIWLFTCIWTV